MSASIVQVKRTGAGYRVDVRGILTEHRDLDALLAHVARVFGFGDGPAAAPARAAIAAVLDEDGGAVVRLRHAAVLLRMAQRRAAVKPPRVAVPAAGPPAVE